jgi:phosphohistidine phosphatase
MRLYFLRHGIAGSASEWEGSDDERPLTPEGRERMEREAETMAHLSLKLDAIITSPFLRALETAEIVADRLALRGGVMVDQRVDPGFSSTRLREIVAERDGEQGLMFVGHEPSFSETVGCLIGGGGIVMKKGGLACVEVSGRELERAELIWLLPPKILAL